MEYLWLFGLMFFTLTFQVVVIFYLLAKYKEAKYNATRWEPPF